MNNQEQADRKLLEEWEAEYRAGFSWTGDKYLKAFEMLIPLVKNLLAAQERLTRKEERDRFDKELEIADERWKAAGRKFKELSDE